MLPDHVANGISVPLGAICRSHDQLFTGTSLAPGLGTVCAKLPFPDG